MTAGSVAARPARPVHTVVGAAPLPVDQLADVDVVMAAYVTHLERTGLAVGTVSKYASHLRRFAAWLAEQPAHPAGQVFTDPFSRDFATRDWRSHLLHERRHAAATIDLSLTALDGLWDWLGLGRTTVDRVSTPGSQMRRFGQHLTRAQDVAVLRAAERRGPRDLAIVAAMRFAGLRIEEVHRLDVTDLWITTGRGAVEVRGKGAKIRTVPLNGAARHALRPWVQARRTYPNADSEQALFLTGTGSRLAVRSMRTVVVQAGRGAGIDGLHPHTLRHTFARGLIDAGVPAPDLQQYLGHASLVTTMRYTRPSAEQAATAIEVSSVEW